MSNNLICRPLGNAHLHHKSRNNQIAGAKLQLFFDMCKKNRNKVKNDNYELAKEVVPLTRKDNYEEEVHSKSLARSHGRIV